ncbi:T9SS type A sorting domain-containing protein [Aquimarina aggregata]|uniref:T9SS type A sorting domain-containing protein n=1 Tax=Aquimarina aggregata TaxID=1642818 RepID=UPI00248F876B|nr:T9SS type A sorting domain-containing protein [Aquimarina aggregata]
MKNLIAFLFLFMTAMSFAQPPTPKEGFRWVLWDQYSDEFNGAELDRSKWRDSFKGWKGRAPAKFDPSTISLRNGNMQIRNKKLPRRDGPYTIGGGAVQSLEKTAYFGYYECKFKASRISMSTTFWMSNPKKNIIGPTKLSGDCAKDKWSQELDICESIGGRFNGGSKFRTQMNFNTHYRYVNCNGDPEKFYSAGNNAVEGNGQQANADLVGSESWEDFHTYGCYWKNDKEVDFYVDDNFAGSVNIRRDVVDSPFTEPMGINMVTETYNWAKPYPNDAQLANNAINTSYYDWIRSYRLIPIFEPEFQNGSNRPTKPAIFKEDIKWVGNPSVNVATKKITIVYEYKANLDRDLVIHLNDANGREVFRKKINALEGFGKNKYVATIDQSLPAGNYSVVADIRPIGGSDTQIIAKTDGNVVTPPGPDGDIVIGNPTNTNATLDGWKSNMVINETDTYTNTTGASQTLKIEKFVFHAGRKGDPVTPFVVKVNGDNNFTVLAAGTARTSNAYNTGENSFAFTTGTTKEITLANGETIASGFLDANANGAGGNIGSVIPFDSNAPADQIWYSGGPDSSNSGNISEGTAPTGGLNTITTLTRNYRFKILLSLVEDTSTADCSVAPSGLVVSNVTNTTVKLSFDNAANDTRTFELRAFPKGGFNGDINTGGLGFAAAPAGSTEITMSNLQANTSYDLVFRALCSGSLPGSTELVTITGTTSGGTVNPETTVLSPVQDAYLQGATNYNSNIVRIENGKRVGYLMFDISGIKGAITDAKLKFTVAGDAGSGNLNVNLGTSNNWNENNLSNANKPALGTLLGSLNKSYNIGATETVTLQANAISGNTISLVLNTTGGNDFALASKENNAATVPQLVITYQPEKLSNDDAVFNTSAILYPNPVKDVMKLTGVSRQARISILDISGKIVNFKTKSVDTSERMIDVSSLTSGIYFVTILENQNKNVLRFSKK